MQSHIIFVVWFRFIFGVLQGYRVTIYLIKEPRIKLLLAVLTLSLCLLAESWVEVEGGDNLCALGWRLCFRSWNFCEFKMHLFLGSIVVPERAWAVVHL